MIPLDLNSILEHLHKKGLKAEFQKETDQIYIVMKIHDQEFPLFIRIYEGSELIQFLAFLPCTIKANTFNDTARLLHLLNKEVDVPGFGMDEENAVVFYRVVLPVKNKKADADLFDAIINAIQLVCNSFTPVVAAVTFGAATFEEIRKKAKEQKA